MEVYMTKWLGKVGAWARALFKASARIREVEEGVPVEELMVLVVMFLVEELFASECDTQK
jgi:hypothetical protein